MIKIFRSYKCEQNKKNSAPTVNTGGYAPKIHISTPNKSDAQGIEAKFCSLKLTKTGHARRKLTCPEQNMKLL